MEETEEADTTTVVADEEASGDVDTNLDSAETVTENTTSIVEEETAAPEPVIQPLPDLPDDLRWIGAYLPE